MNTYYYFLSITLQFVLHANSDVLRNGKDRSEDAWSAARATYEKRLETLLKFIRKRVGHVIVIGPGLFTAQGEIIEHWEDKDQFNIIKVNRMQSHACRKLGLAHIDLREHLQSAIREQAKAGVVSKDLTFMIGNKKEWHHSKEGILKKGATTYDYQGEGGLFTFDGEHLNLAGTKEFVQLLTEQLQKFKGIWIHKAHSEDEKVVADKMHKHKKLNKHEKKDKHKKHQKQVDVVDTEDVEIEVTSETENSAKRGEKLAPTYAPTILPTAKIKKGKKLKKKPLSPQL